MSTMYKAKNSREFLPYREFQFSILSRRMFYKMETRKSQENILEGSHLELEARMLYCTVLCKSFCRWLEFNANEINHICFLASFHAVRIILIVFTSLTTILARLY